MGSDPASTVPPAGRELLFEHVHFDWEGNYQLARLMAEGAAGLLFGGEPNNRPWLDSAGSAAALAYTEHERLTVLQHLADIVRKPPFSNQLTYGEDQTRLAREIDRFETAAHQPENLRRAKTVAEAAIAADPDNPDLAGIAGGVARDQGDWAEAIAQARRVADLLPADPAPLAELASLLAQHGDFEEAGRILRSGANQSSEPDKLEPAQAALAIRMKRFAEGREHLDQAIARQPANLDYRIMRGNLERIAGNYPAAEAEFRAVLRANPANQSALEGLVSLLIYLGQTKAAEQASQDQAEQQTRNQLNNLRVAQIYEGRGDEVQAVRFLLAAASSGPVPTAVEVSIAKKLHREGRNGEALLHLAQARRLSKQEEDAEITASIDEIIGRLRTGDQ
jgi:predicted Zn-dependent protease